MSNTIRSILIAALAFAVMLTSGVALAEERGQTSLLPPDGEAAVSDEAQKEKKETASEQGQDESSDASAKGEAWDEYTYVKTRTQPITAFERAIVEQGFRLLPYDHPFLIAYERTYNVKIDSYVAQIGGVTVSGIPFHFGGKGNYEGFNDKWWTRTGVGRYPVRGLDCAKYLSWIYRQLGIQVADTSTSLFFSGKYGVERRLPGIRPHLVLRSLEEAMIGDIAYNSERQNYSSGHGSHVQMYLGTANILGISDELKKMYPNFPCDAHLVLDCGWSDGEYYYNLMRKLKVPNPRRGMAGVGVQFFTSIKSGGAYLYKSPKNVYAWKNPQTQNTFRIESRLEKNGRLLQYKPQSKAEFIINISRPIQRPDVDNKKTAG